ncbi:protease, M48 family [Chitinispirillum alkaliphilum]|nr:protease, M48 family [Chitinispirillum alkaliphilum]
MNAMKTTVLLATLTGMLILFGHMMGGHQGATMALLFAGVMNFVSFWYSDKIVLKMYRAQEIGPRDVPQLYNIVKNLAEKNNMPMPRVYVINSESPNAFATGRSPRHASVAATVGIMRLLNNDELEGVMAHELAHVKNRDTLISTVAATIAGAITWIAMMIRWGAMFGGGMRGGNNRNNALGSLALAILAPIAAMFIQMAISRSREFSADATGAKICGKPLALANALTKLQQASQVRPMRGGSPSTAHMFIVNPFKGGIGSLFSTHPPMEERVQKLQQLSRMMP